MYCEKVQEQMVKNSEFSNNEFISSHNKKEVIEYFHETIKMGVEFKASDSIVRSMSYESLYNIFHEEMPKNGMALDNLLVFAKDHILPYSTNFSSPYSMAFPDAGNSTAAISGALLSDLINQNLINWKPCAPVGTIIEIVLLNWIRELIGYSVIKNPKNPMDVGGVVTVGGVSSNTIAQLIAREVSMPDSMKKGVNNQSSQVVAIVPNGIDHYSSRLSMGWLGLGEKNVIKAPTKNFKYDIQSLSSIMSSLHDGGKKIISLTAYAGDSRSMTCDNFLPLRKLCDKYGTWLHVDGCHGTQLLFSEKLKEKTLGIELADSVTLDPHKVLNVPYVVSILLLKDPSKIKKIQRPEDIITGESHSFGQVTPFFGSRNFSSLKLYFLIKNLGKSGLGIMIEQRHEMACLLAEKILLHEEFTLINPKVDMNSVIFMYTPKTMDKLKLRDAKDYLHKLNNLNTNIHHRLLDNGEIWLHNFSIQDLSNTIHLGSDKIIRPLRFMSGNPLLNELHLDEMLKLVEEYGRNLLINNELPNV